MIYDVLEVSRHIINYSNEKDYDISNLKLQKLLYFVQAAFLMKKGTPCFSEKIEAWSYGPIVPQAYNEFARFGAMSIPKVKHFFVRGRNFWDVEKIDFQDCAIEKEDKKILDAVVDKFSAYSAWELAKLTQNQSPWRKVYSPYSYREIKPEELKSYFS